MAEKYFLKLREDIPPGFIENDRIPELPAAYKFLQIYAGRKYRSKQEFEDDLAGFPKYLRQNNIPPGFDEEVRKGIFLFDNNAVGTLADPPSERCELGRLEKEVSGI